jgi:hypothetical protein
VLPTANSVPFEPPLAATCFVLVGSRSAAASGLRPARHPASPIRAAPESSGCLLRPYPSSASDVSRWDGTYGEEHLDSRIATLD